MRIVATGQESSRVEADIGSRNLFAFGRFLPAGPHPAIKRAAERALMASDAQESGAPASNDCRDVALEAATLPSKSSWFMSLPAQA